jgi:hypothetical protein
MSKRAERLRSEASVMSYLQERVEDERTEYDAVKNRRTTIAMAREGVFLDRLTDILKDAFKGGVAAPSGYAKKTVSSTPKKRIVNIALSDLHYHSLLDPREVPFEYGPLEEARRTAQIVQEVSEYKPQYRDDTELFVHIFGDIIQGDLHDPRDAATMTEQFAAATFLLTQALTAWSATYKRVTARCVPGNHGRNKRRHPERATTQKWDSFENMIYFALKMAVATLPNVKIEIPYTPFYTYQAFDQQGFVTHGDTVLDAGFPSSTIDIKKVRNHINELNAGEPDKDSDFFLIGHVHCGATVEIPSGPTFMSNGCLVPPDGFAVSRGIRKQKCGQQLWESVPGHICGDRRFLNVDEKTDKDSSLDKIVKPYLGFETESPLRRK